MSGDAFFAREPLAGLLNDGLEPLLVKHWKEVAHDQGAIALNPDWPHYFREEQAGRFVSFSVRIDGKLIGYNGFLYGRSLHYRDHLFAMNDVIFLEPEYRGINGLLLIVGAEQWLKAQGVSKVFYHVKADRFLGSPDGDSLEAIDSRMELEERFGVILPDAAFEGDRTLGGALQRLGYGLVENHFGKLLNGD